MASSARRFHMQRSVRRPWRRYVDQVTVHRQALHAYCCRLTGNVWDGEDLVQDTLMRVFSLLGKTDARLENPKAYLIRTATNLWITGSADRHASRRRWHSISLKHRPRRTTPQTAVPPRRHCFKRCTPRSVRLFS